MEPGDIDRIVLLEQDGLSPWDRDALVREIEFESGVQFVLEGEGCGDIIGWCCSRWFDTEAELLKITVMKGKRRDGIASALLAHLVRHLAVHGVATLFLEVRADNLPALRFYRKHGFNEVGRRRGYYADPADDALIFSKDLLDN
jgi:ribosomal-protein-alanine N-acetyltransferase